MNQIQKWKSSEELQQHSEGNDQISLYKDDLVNQEAFEQQSIRLEQAFPAINADWFLLLSERIKVNNFTNKRLKDAVDHLIDTCIHFNPTIAQVINFDKKIKFYTQYDIQKILEKEGRGIINHFERIEYNGNLMYVSKEYACYFKKWVDKEPKPITILIQQINREAWKGFAERTLQMQIVTNYDKVDKTSRSFNNKFNNKFI